MPLTPAARGLRVGVVVLFALTSTSCTLRKASTTTDRAVLSALAAHLATELPPFDIASHSAGRSLNGVIDAPLLRVAGDDPQIDAELKDWRRRNADSVKLPRLELPVSIDGARTPLADTAERRIGFTLPGYSPGRWRSSAVVIYVDHCGVTCGAVHLARFHYTHGRWQLTRSGILVVF